MALDTVTRDQVIELANTMPPEKLARWYEFGLFIQSRPLTVADVEDDEARLQQELAAWEAASDEDWIKMERTLEEAE